MNSVRIFFQRYLNGANILLFLLVFFVILNSFVRVKVENQNTHSKTETTEVRVVSFKNSYFSEKTYLGYSQGKFYELKSSEYLEIGKKIKTNSEINYYTFDEQTTRYDQYKKTIGIAGTIELAKDYLVQQSCDINCLLIKKIASIKDSIQKKYLKSACESEKWIINIFARGVDCKDVYALSYGLVLGGTEHFNKQTKENFKDLGLTHLVAVSGFQVVLVLLFLEWFATNIGINRTLKITLILLGILTLIFLAGPQPPILRSSISIFLSLFVLTFLGRMISPFRALAYSGVILLLINPFYLFSASFQLSFLASFGLVSQSWLNNNKTKKDWEISWIKNLKSIFSTSFFAYLFTLPVVLNLSGQTTPLAILTNLLVIPFIPLISIFNILGLIPFLGSLFLVISVFLESVILHFVNNINNFSWIGVFTLKSKNLVFWEYLLYYLVLLLIIWLIKKLTKISKNSN